MNKSRIKMQAKLRNITTLTGWKTLIAMEKKYPRYKKFPNHQRIKDMIFSSTCNWQDRISWMDRIIDWTGPRGENLEWQIILHNSKDKAESLRKSKIDRAKSDKNPWKNHGGKLSPFSDKFIGKTAKDEAIKNMKLTMSLNPSNQNTRIEYYLKRGMGLCQSVNALKARQSVGRLDRFVERYGETEGNKRWKQRQEKWLKSCKKTNYSKVSQELFDEIISLYQHDKSGIYYATFDREDMKNYTNKEYTLKTSRSFVKPDFICVNKNKIIEFDGSYWHNSNKQSNYKREKQRDDEIISMGFEIIHIKESDYKKNKEKVIAECINFLTQ